MAQYKTLNIKMSNSQLNKLKSGIKSDTEVTLKLSSNVAGDCNDEINSPQKLLLTNTQVSKLWKGVANGSSANIKLLKTHLHNVGQSGGFLDRPLRQLLKTELSVMKNVWKLLGKSVLIPIGLTAAASAADATTHN